MTPLNRRQMAWRAAQDIRDGMVVNLGMGMPVHVADYVPDGVDLFIHSENGVVGAGPLASAERADPDLVDASSRRITLRAGAAIVDSAWSFAMIRGGHIDVTILGAFEVARNGDLANWDMRLPNKGPLVGGAMDLAACARAVWVIMEHVTRKSAPRLLEACTLPLTAVRCVRAPVRRWPSTRIAGRWRPRRSHCRTDPAALPRFRKMPQGLTNVQSSPV